MKKNHYELISGVCKIWKSKFLKRMRIVVLLILISITQTFALDTYAQNKRLSLNFKNEKIINILEEIEDQSEFYFMFDASRINVEQRKSVDCESQSIRSILDQLFESTGIKYSINDRQVLLTITDKFDTEQQKIVSGKVTDSSGEPLPGVTVVVKGTTQGTITGSDGTYSLSSISENDMLQFSFVGMKAQEVGVAEKTTINVMMEEDAIGIEEVVAVGYGEQSRAKLTSSVSTLDPEKISDIPFSEFGGSLAGRASGVIIQNNGGNPGAIPSISIRGGATPLFVIDGIIRDINVFSALNRSDIESISFLKDASATAVYGSRASNGIILIKTKKGETNSEARINYSNNFAWDTPTVPTDMISSYNYALMKNEVLKQQGKGTYAAYTEEELEIIKNGTDTDNYPNTDWWGTVIKKHTPQQEHNLSINGGTNTSKYFIGLGLIDQGSMYKNNATTYNRYSYRANYVTSFEKIGLDVGLDLNGYILENKYPPYGELDIFSNIVSRSPLDKAYNEDGTISIVWPNPLALLESPGYDKRSTYYNDIKLNFTWNVPWIEGLKLSALGDYTLNTYNSNTLTGSAAQYDDLGNETIMQSPQKTVYNKITKEWNLEYHLDYSKTWGMHNLSALVLYTANAAKISWFQAYRKNYLSATVGELFAGDPSTQTNDGSSSEWGRIGSVGRLKYDYANKYFVEISGRYDGSDLFPKENRFGFFPAVALGWSVLEENFMQNFKAKNIINALKFRGSAGVVGNVDGISTFTYIPTYNLNSQIYTIAGSLVNGYSDGGLVSQDISWYTTKSVDFGIDFKALNNHLEGTFDYFYSRTSGYVTSPKVDYYATLGTSLPVVKSDAAFRKAGFDGELLYKNKISDFNYQIGFNFTTYKSLWEYANESETTKSNPYLRTEGIVQNYYGIMLPSLGLYQSIEQIINNPRRLGATALTTGDIWYEDMNGDGKIDSQDNRRLGDSSSPKLVYGIPINISYKAWSLNLLLQGTGKRNLYMGRYVMSDRGRITYEYQTDYWTPDNTNSVFPRLTGTGYNSGNNAQSTSYWLLDGSYVRLKSLVISYDLKKSVLKNQSWLNKCTVFFSGTNLFTISDISKYFDPEAAYSDWSSTFAYPVYKNYSLGLNIGF